MNKIEVARNDQQGRRAATTRGLRLVDGFAIPTTVSSRLSPAEPRKEDIILADIVKTHGRVIARLGKNHVGKRVGKLPYRVIADVSGEHLEDYEPQMRIALAKQ